MRELSNNDMDLASGGQGLGSYPTGTLRQQLWQLRNRLPQGFRIY